MKINGEDIKTEELYKTPSMLKNHNGIYISDEQNEILKRYDINVDYYKDVKTLIYDIEEYLNNTQETFEDLEWVSETLSEFNYYNNTNK